MHQIAQPQYRMVPASDVDQVWTALSFNPGATRSDLRRSPLVDSDVDIKEALDELERRGRVRSQPGPGTEWEFYALSDDRQEVRRRASTAFPRPGSSTERILQAIRQNPGITKSGLIKLVVGASNNQVAASVDRLVKRGMIERETDEQGWQRHRPAGGDE